MYNAEHYLVSYYNHKAIFLINRKHFLIVDGCKRAVSVKSRVKASRKLPLLLLAKQHFSFDM